MKHRTAARSWVTAALLASATGLTVCVAQVVPASASPAAASTSLTGTLYLTAGSCAHGSISGSFIQMILPSGSESGPYMSNSDSSCSNQAYTLLAPGSEGGLRFGAYQPLPSPPFDSAGNAQARSISAPAQYEGTAFATSTNPVDPQTHARVPAPSLTVHGDTVSANLSSFSVSWNNQYFNQGSPKPDGSDPGITRPATGTYDASTGAMTLSWTSEVVGGPFDKFTGSWHMVGRFVSSTSASTGSSTHSGGGAAPAAAGSPQATSTSTATATASAAAGKGTKSNGGGGATAQTASQSSTAPAPELAATTSIVSKHTWHVSWWLIALALVIAVLGFGGLATLGRPHRPEPTEST
jgi:hypothetical protein